MTLRSRGPIPSKNRDSSSVFTAAIPEASMAGFSYYPSYLRVSEKRLTRIFKIGRAPTMLDCQF
jgi:hypothetical protein